MFLTSDRAVQMTKSGGYTTKVLYTLHDQGTLYTTRPRYFIHYTTKVLYTLQDQGTLQRVVTKVLYQLQMTYKGTL